jgi:hypothetical protein
MKKERDSLKRNTNKTNTKKSNKNDINNDEQKNLYQTNYQSSESVIKCILDKIIISAIRSSQSREIDEQMGIFCFNNFQKQVTSLFETNFINYTDDLPHSEPQLLWEFTPPPENTWVELPEPSPQEMDRYESSNIAYVEVKKDQQENQLPSTTLSTNSNEKKNLNKNNKNKIGKKEAEPLSWNNNNVIDEVEEKSSLSGFDGEMIMGNGAIPEVSGIEDKFSESLNITDAEIKKNIDNVQEIVEKEENVGKDKEKDNKNINNNIVNTSPKKESNKNLDNIKVINEEKKENAKSRVSTQTTLPPIKKKGKNVPIADYPFSDIPGVEEEYNHDNFEPQNVEFLRREREELIQKKIIENKLKETANKTIKPIEENEKNKKKLIDTNRYSFDPNGKIIQFRPYKFDNLSKDFVITRNTIRGFENKVDNSLPNKKRIPNNKEKDKKEKEKEIHQEEIIRNFEEEKKTKEINNIVNYSNTEKERFVPSGSNFQIISPNIGVVIKENNQAKEGPREFSKYFKKYSIQDYDKMLNDFVPLQNRTMLQNHLNSSINNSKYLSTAPNNNTITSKRNSIINALDSSNNINNNTENPINPLLSNEDQSSYFMDKDKSINNSGFNINMNSNSNNPLLPSNMNSINFNRYNESYNSINMDNSVVMKKLGTGSLKLELESLKDLSTINSEIIKIPNKRKNIFGSNFNKNNKTYNIKATTDKNNFNEFNKKIMVTQGWGNDNGDSILKAEFKQNNNNAVYSRHITKQQVLRELGSNILNGIKIRLPRNRKVDIKNNI